MHTHVSGWDCISPWSGSQPPTSGISTWASHRLWRRFPPMYLPYSHRTPLCPVYIWQPAQRSCIHGSDALDFMPSEVLSLLSPTFRQHSMPSWYVMLVTLLVTSCWRPEFDLPLTNSNTNDVQNDLDASVTHPAPAVGRVANSQRFKMRPILHPFLTPKPLPWSLSTLTTLLPPQSNGTPSTLLLFLQVPPC